MFKLDGPGRAIGREIPRLSAAADEWKPADRRLLGEVGEAARPINDGCIGRVVCDHLLRVSVKGVNTQRNAVVENTHTTANDSLLVRSEERRVGKESRAWWWTSHE